MFYIFLYFAYVYIKQNILHLQNVSRRILVNIFVNDQFNVENTQQRFYNEKCE